MTRTVHPAGHSLLRHRTHYHAKLWLIERKDGVRKFLTNHDREVRFNPIPFSLNSQDWQTYKPTGSFNASANESQDGLKSKNKTLTGTITTSEITDADLHAGLYLDAKLTEYLVDYRFPMLGAITTDVYWVSEIERAQDVHEVRVVGISRFLERPVGDVITRLCPYALGDFECKKDLTNMRRNDVVVASVENNLVFTATSATTPVATTGSDPDLADDYFALGVLNWKTGANAGVESRVARFTLENREFGIRVQTPHPVSVGDTFDVFPGCNKTLEFCHSQFDNKDNFGGDHFVPGAHRLHRGPEMDTAPPA